MKAAFDELFRSPFVARVMMAELDPDGGDAFFTIDADGSFAQSGGAGGPQRQRGERTGHDDTTANGQFRTAP